MKRTLTLWAVATLWALAVPAGAQEARPMPLAPLAEQRVEAASGGCAGAVERGMFDGPVSIGFFSADYATGRRACARSEVGLGILGGAAIDTADFYGALSGGALLYGSYALSPALEVFGALEAVKLQYVQNASLKGTSVAMGQATLGATWAALRQGALVVAPSARLMLPTDFSMPNVRTVGVELGAAVSYRLSERFEVHGYAGGDLSAGLSAAGSLPRPGLLASAGAQYSLTPWAGAVLDLNGHAGEYAYLAPALGLRFTLAKVVGIELGGTLPLLGTLRNDAALGLKVAYRL